MPRCKNPDCTLSQSGRCAKLFEAPATECDEFLSDEAPPAETGGEALSPAPWLGRHLGPQEAERLMYRAPARVIAVLGPANSGKTCLLLSFFLQLTSSQRDGFPYRFASSFTLHGFRGLIERAALWRGQPGEDIVSHTPKGEERPRFLHLGLRPQDRRDDRYLDLLISDLPGEWITDWAGKLDERAERRLSFLPRADAFLVLVDVNDLLSDKWRHIDAQISKVLRRLLPFAGGGNGLALLFTKFDRAVQRILPPAQEQALRKEAWGDLGRRAQSIFAALHQLAEGGMAVRAMAVSAFPGPLDEGQPVGIMAPFCHVMTSADQRTRWRRPARVLPEPIADPFWALGFTEREA